MKAIKWILASILAVIVGVVVYITVIFNPNDFKPQLVDQVKQQTGRDLNITKDLSWTFFPTLGIQLGGISLSNPQGFSLTNMIEVNQAVAEVALMPLFSSQVEVSQLNLDGLKVNLVTQKNGKTSFDGLSSSDNPKDKEVADEKTASKFDLKGLNIGGVSITNTQINMLDETTGVTQTFSLKALTLGQFALGQSAPLHYEFEALLPGLTFNSVGDGNVVVGSDLNTIAVSEFAINNTFMGEGIPNKKLVVSLKNDINITLDQQVLSLVLNELVAADIKGSGKVDVNYGKAVPEVVAKLDMGDIDLDALMPKETEDKPASEKPVETAKAVEPDLRGMKGVNLTLGLTATSIKVANVLTQNWVLDTQLRNGVLNVKKLTADLYKGRLTASAKLDGRKAVSNYQFNNVLSGVQVGELLKDAAEVDFLSGAASFNVNGSGKSLLPDNIKKNLVAKGKFEVADGSVYGVNIPHMIRGAKAKLSGDMSSSDAKEQKTDFSSLTGGFALKSGVATNPDLNMASPLIRLKGAGKANIVTESIDYKLSTTVVGSLEGQGADESLKGVEIPFAIKGTFQEPKFSLDTSGLLDSKIKQETEKVKEKAKDKLKDTLLEKFGGF